MARTSGAGCRIPNYGIHLTEGWEAESAQMRRGMEQFPVPNASVASVRRERMNVRIGTDIAWATFDQYATKTGDPPDLGNMQHQMRILEKHDGVWKIACISALEPWFQSADHPAIGIDADVKVLWMNDRRQQGASRPWADGRRRTSACPRAGQATRAFRRPSVGRRARLTT